MGSTNVSKQATQEELLQLLAAQGLQSYTRKPMFVQAVKVPFAFSWEGWISEAGGYLVKLTDGTFRVMGAEEFEQEFTLLSTLKATTVTIGHNLSKCLS